MKIAMRELRGMELQKKDFEGKWLDEMQRMIKERGLSEHTTKYRITYKKDGKWYLIPAGQSGISISLKEFIRTHGVMWEMIDKVKGIKVSARQLTTGQKRFIDKVMETHKGVWGQRDLSKTELAQLEKMNDYETLYQDIERYISDQVAEGKNDKWL